MRYTVRHVTRFTYETAITESVMEARTQPRGDAHQRCLHFALSTVPASRVMVYQDSEGNVVHHFNIPGRHGRLALTAQAVVESVAPPEIPAALSPDAGKELDDVARTGEGGDLLRPSRVAGTTPPPFRPGRPNRPAPGSRPF